MKIRLRITLCFAAVVLVMVGFLSFYVNHVLTERVQREKSEEYARSLAQLATSVSLTTREMEQTLFNQYNSRGVAGAMLAEQDPTAKTLSVQNLLSTVPINASHIQSVLAVDIDGSRYFSGKLPEYRPDTIENILSPELYDTFTLWLRDDEGHVFLKKDVYQVFPLKYAGILVAQVDAPGLAKALGLDGMKDGTVAVISEQGRLILQTGELTEETLDKILRAEPLSFRAVSREINLDGEDWWLTMQPAVNQSWYTLRLTRRSVMLAMPIALKNVILMGSLGIIAAAFVINAVMTHSLTRRVKKLLDSMEAVSRGDFNTPIPVTGRDEIGELAERFRWMEEELKALTEKMILRATEKQQAEYEMLELRYRSLLAQISPHFLCNVLSSINALAVMGKNGQVSDLAIKSARYLRDNLEASDEKFTTLGQEIQFVEEYVDLYREVYQYSCSLDADVKDDVVECRVPNMLLQPLVENALVHGGASGEDGRTRHIRVLAERDGPDLVIRVINDGQRISPEVIETVERAGTDQELNKKMKGFGLRGVLQRLRLLYGEKQSLHIGYDPDEGNCILIRIPYERTDEA